MSEPSDYSGILPQSDGGRGWCVGWRPIEIAPKDGTWIFVTGNRFMDEEIPPFGLTRWETCFEDQWERSGPRSQRLVTTDKSNWNSDCGIFPRHWVPLPNPPPTE